MKTEILSETEKILSSGSVSLSGCAESCPTAEFIGDDVEYIEFVGDDVEYIEFVGDDVEYIEFVGDDVGSVGDDSPVPVPPADCACCPLRRENSELRCEAAYWREMHRRAVEREEKLKEENRELKAKLRLRERQLFEKKSEQNKKKTERQQEDGDREKRKRGQQPGSPGHGRRRHENLPAEDETYDIPEDERHCPCCGLPYAPFPGTEDSETVEVRVRAHVRRIRRIRYKRTCSCRNLPVVVVADGPDRLIPKGAYGDSVWTQVLLDKFLFHRPTCRFLESLRLIGLDISQGTVTDGLKRLAPFFDPVYEQIVAENRTETHWHADETRWTVFEEVRGKTGHRWYLWVFKSASSVLFILDQSRSSAVPKAHLGEAAPGSILSVDRYSAYKSFAMEKDGCILLAWCWAHVRRDFLSLAKDRPEHEMWAMEWIEQIGVLYHLNNRRLELSENPDEFAEADRTLRDQAEKMEERCAAQLEEKCPPDCEKVLLSLGRHWDGLTLFLDHPEVPMDNNAAERALRGPVVGRKNYGGSGAVWSGLLAAAVFSIFQTLMHWDVNPQVWLERFFRACAAEGGRPPEDVSPFLPWNMSEEELGTFRDPPGRSDGTSL